MRNRGWAAAGATGMGGLVLLLAACGSSGTNTSAGSAYGGSSMGASPSSSAMSGGAMGTKTVTLAMKATKIGSVLTNAQGDTLYWYSKDTKDGPSTCTSSCLAQWPMVAGKAVAASGVKFAGALGGVTDAGGAIQATYNGYPLYTFKGDMTPGQTSGNDEGGVWHVVTGSALTAAAGMSSPSATKSTTSSGGYGYGSGVPVGSGGTSSGSRTSATQAKATTAPAPPAPAPTTAAPVVTAPTPGSTEGAGCGEGACW